MSARWAACAALLSTTAGAAKPARSSAHAAADGGVIYVTQKHAFLNRGKADGVAPGMELALERRGKAISRCKVDAVSDHTASCVGGGPRPGDTFALDTTKSAPVEAARPPQVASPAELAARAAAVQQAPLQKVEFAGQGGPTFGGESFTAEADLSHDVWTSQPNGGDRTFQSEQLDIDLRGLDLTHGLKLFVNASLVSWSQRPSQYRLPQSDSTLLYVRETEVTRRDSGSLTAAIGRLWPVDAPGAGVVDGLQVGWRFTPKVEAGVYGGSMPDPITTMPTTSRWTAGAYFGWESSDEPTALVSYVRQTGRVAVLSIPDPNPDLRAQLETDLLMRLKQAADVEADVRLGAGSAGNAPGLLEAARLDVTARPADSGLRFSGGVRYVGLVPTDFVSLGETLYDHRSLHADVTAGYAFGQIFSLSVLGGIARDYETLFTRAEGGPEITFPHALGEHGALSAGFLFEYGWWGSRDAYLQMLLVPSKTLRLLVRAAFLQDAPAQGTGNFLVRELASMASAEIQLNRLLFLRLAATGTVDLNFPELDPSSLRDSSPWGLTGSVTLGGRI